MGGTIPVKPATLEPTGVGREAVRVWAVRRREGRWRWGWRVVSVSIVKAPPEIELHALSNGNFGARVPVSHDGDAHSHGYGTIHRQKGQE